MSTVKMSHPDSEEPITVNEDQVDVYAAAGWTPIPKKG